MHVQCKKYDTTFFLKLDKEDFLNFDLELKRKTKK